jgi:peptide-methionine (S)-S-oxide reductase
VSIVFVATSPLAALTGRSPQATGDTPRRPARMAEDTAVFAGGCFWGIEAVFEHLKGVSSAVSGYAGGSVSSPSYEQVSEGTSGHAEAVQVVYDPARITYQQLLQVFFTVAHDPTQRNRQGPDVGTQYRSVVFYRGERQQRRAATEYIAALGRAKAYPRPIVTEVVALRAFYPAEEYHQNYMARHPRSPYILAHDVPKIERLKREFAAWYRE